jgi:glycoprotein-N-acetylgalactosamine 3-beta-galactosyltransferase
MADQEKNNYIFLLKSKIDDFKYHFHLKSVRICCLVATSPNKLLTRAQAVNATWGSRCDKLFFVTELPQMNMTLEEKEFAKKIPIAPLDNIKSGYDHLTQKSILAFVFVYKTYFNDFDWFVKADDDTYLIIENLKDFLRKQDTSQPITFGYNFQVISFLYIFFYQMINYFRF